MVEIRESLGKFLSEFVEASAQLFRRSRKLPKRVCFLG